MNLEEAKKRVDEISNLAVQESQSVMARTLAVSLLKIALEKALDYIEAQHRGADGTFPGFDFENVIPHEDPHDNNDYTGENVQYAGGFPKEK